MRRQYVRQAARGRRRMQASVKKPSVLIVEDREYVVQGSALCHSGDAQYHELRGGNSMRTFLLQCVVSLFFFPADACEEKISTMEPPKESTVAVLVPLKLLIFFR